MTDEQVQSLGIGLKYQVDFEDCCVSGEFEAVLVDKVYHEWPADSVRFLDFGNGVRLSNWLNVSMSL